MSNYSATIVEIKTLRKHDNADRLQITNIFGNNVIVGLDIKIGDKGIFFPLESQIGKEFSEFNNLIRKTDENGKNIGGLFESNRRVKAVKLRGEKSMGFFIPIISLDNFIYEFCKNEKIPPLWESFDKIGIYEISKKYENQKDLKISKSNKNKLIDNICNGQFKFHYDTEQFGKYTYKIKPDDLIAITWKLHGTSSITSNVLVNRKLNILEKVIDYLKFGNIVKSEYSSIFSSRKVIKNKEENNNFYNTDIWSLAGKRFNNLLYNGETVYYEIVGYLPDGGYIQKDHDYLCDVGNFEIYVYRITIVNNNGNIIEYPWPLVKERCNDIGLKHVPEIYYGKAKYLVDNYNNIDVQYFGDELLKVLQEKYVYDQDSIFCKNKVPEEGIVIRHEKANKAYKIKSFKHYEFETKLLDKNEYDIESEN